jgi:hypothetical protein
VPPPPPPWKLQWAAAAANISKPEPVAASSGIPWKKMDEFDPLAGKGGQLFVEKCVFFFDLIVVQENQLSRKSIEY